jgi:hypothetical protein
MAEDSFSRLQSQQGYRAEPSTTGIHSGQSPAVANPSLVIPGAQPSPAIDLPQVWRPTAALPLPPVPPVMPNPIIPANFVGCWKGNPGRYEEFTWLAGGYYNIGVPGEIVFCYRNNTIEVPQAKVYISPAKRALDLAMNIGLNYNTATAHSVSTEIYSITPAKIHAHTRLTVVLTAHLFLILPIDVADEPVVEDSTGTLVAPDRVLIESREVLYSQGQPIRSATWHAYFHRITDGSFQ